MQQNTRTVFLLFIILTVTSLQTTGQRKEPVACDELLAALRQKDSLLVRNLVHRSVSETTMFPEALRLDYYSGLAYTLFLHRGVWASGPYVEHLQELLQEHPRDTLAARGYYMTGLYFRLQANYKEAQPAFTATIQILDSLGVVNEILYKSLNNVAQSHRKDNELSRARDYTLRSLRVMDSLKVRGTHLYRALNTLATIYYDLGSLKEFKYSCERIEDMYRRNEIKKMRDICTFHLLFGIYYSIMQDHEMGLYYRKRALAYYDSLPYEDTELHCSILDGISYGYLYSGKSRAARRYSEQAIRQAEGVLPAGKVAAYISNLAHTYRMTEEYSTAGALLQRASRICRKEYGPGSLRYLGRHTNYLSFLREHQPGKLTPAMVEDLISTADATHVKDQALAVRIRRLLTHWYLEQGDLPRAGVHSAYMLQADTAHWKTGVGDYSRISYDSLPPVAEYVSYTVPRLEYLLAMIHQQPTTELLEEGMECADQILGRVETYRSENTSEESRMDVVEDYNKYYRQAVYLAWRYYDQTGTGEALERVFRYMEKGKAANLLAALRQKKAMRLNLPDSLHRVERQMRLGIALLQENILEEQIRENPDPVLLRVYREELFLKQLKLDSLENTLERDYPGYYQLKYNHTTVTTRELRKKLSRAQTFINYYLTDSLLYAMVVHKKGARLYTQPLPMGFYEEIHTLRDQLMNLKAQGNILKRKKDFMRVSHGLYKTVMAPLENDVMGDELIISSHGILSYIPLAILLSDTLTDDATMHYRDLPYLLRDYGTSYANSATVYCRHPRSARSWHNQALVFAPEYPEEPDDHAILSMEETVRQTPYSIPGAMQEAQTVHDLCGGTLLQGDEATEFRFKRVSSDHDIIHMAMHTLINDREPMLSRMIFAPEKDTPENGMLSTLEIYDQPITSKMVVLSSCNTGAGKIRQGEGIMSMARAFAYAGSPSVIMSAWEVQDDAGVDLMAGFYQYLKKGYSKSKALQKSRLDFLENATQVRSLPYFWSSYLIIGDEDPLFLNPYRFIVTGMAVVLLVIGGIILAKKQLKSRSNHGTQDLP